MEWELKQLLEAKKNQCNEEYAFNNFQYMDSIAEYEQDFYGGVAKYCKKSKSFKVEFDCKVVFETFNIKRLECFLIPFFKQKNFKFVD